MSKVALLEDFYQAIWVNGDLDAIETFFAPDARIEGMVPGLVLTPADFVTYVQAMLTVISEPQIHVLRVVEQGEWLAGRTRCECLSNADGRKIALDAQIMMHFEGGRIVHAYNSIDTANLMIQFGMLPPDAVEQVMTGRIP